MLSDILDLINVRRWGWVGVPCAVPDRKERPADFWNKSSTV